MKSTTVKLTEEQQAELREMLERHLNLSVKSDRWTVRLRVLPLTIRGFALSNNTSCVPPQTTRFPLSNESLG